MVTPRTLKQQETSSEPGRQAEEEGMGKRGGGFTAGTCY